MSGSCRVRKCVLKDVSKFDEVRLKLAHTLTTSLSKSMKLSSIWEENTTRSLNHNIRIFLICSAHYNTHLASCSQIYILHIVSATHLVYISSRSLSHLLLYNDISSPPIPHEIITFLQRLSTNPLAPPPDLRRNRPLSPSRDLLRHALCKQHSRLRLHKEGQSKID
jgi:hypothetical protein